MATTVMAMPLETLLSNPNPTIPRPRSLLSRFSSPLSKHARNMFELAIEPEDPFKIYSPGEAVKGHICLTVLKGFDITHLVIALHGYVKVYKHQIAPGEGLPVDDELINGKGTRSFEYHGNGLASLFQEEQILCGQGFLKKSVYKFAFELQFPTKSLPSTIEFERGTISYMISATLTRPTTIAPTTTCHKRIKFQDSVDIAPLNMPKSRVISLEPVSGRGKVKKVRQSGSVGTHDGSSRDKLSRKETQNSAAPSATIPIGNPPLSPAPSEDTVASATTNSTQSFQVVEHDSPPNRKPSPQTSDTRSSTTSSSAHTITATTELPRHGALPGDMIPVRVMVTHTKPYVKGVVIATLYRQGRIDMHPAIPLATKNKDKRAEYEDVYPRSRTGLGGLYFANASPSSVFRKDLSQSSTMMIINPQTLTANITTSVKVPDASFPTIANVPGGMISFTYHIEVVIDLFGRLGETRLLPRLTSSEPTFTHTHDTGNQLSSEWSNSILDTTQLRRTKSVVCFEMSLVIGTKDSARRKRPDTEAFPTNEMNDQGYDQPWSEDMYRERGYDDYYYYDQSGQPHYYDGYEEHDMYNGEQEYYPPYQHQEHSQDYRSYYHNHHRHYDRPAMDIIPPPPEPQEEADEKTRLRRREELLLPSQPPQDGEPSSSSAALTPTAPVLANGVDHEPQLAHDDIPTPSTPEPAASVVSARSADTIRARSASPPPLPVVHDALPTDDKQELERRRLMALASAPPSDETEAGSSSNVARSGPSAPVVVEDEYNAQTLNHDVDGSELPQYER